MKGYIDTIKDTLIHLYSELYKACRKLGNRKCFACGVSNSKIATM